MKTKICLLTLAMVMSCEKNKDVPQGPVEINLNKTTHEIIKSDNAFGLSLFQEILASDTESENVFISPTSVSLALAMTYNGAEGDTKTAMEAVLKKNGFSSDEINSGYKELMDALVSVDQKVILEIANSIWYRQGFTILPNFISINQQYYNAQVSSLDFSLPGAPGIINDWVSENTNDRIKEIVREIPAEAVMYLINAIYFKGICKYEFKKEDTGDGPFYLKNGSAVNVPVMKQVTDLRFVANDIFSMVELPYGQGNYSMLVLLPNNANSTDDVVEALTPENWDVWINGLTVTKVDLRLPKFTYEYKNVLNDELMSLGMEVAFTDQADFSGINGTGDLFISKVLHKSFVEVNEEGTEAAAVTSVEIDVTSFPGPENTIFNVDHPFLFAIREISTGTILFVGRVQNPLSETNGS